MYTAILATSVALLASYLYLSVNRLAPGPWLAKVTNLWKLYTFSKGFQHIVDYELHERYGPVVQVGPDSLMFNSLEAFKFIYGINPNIEKGDYYLMSGDRSPELSNVFTARQPYHRRKRAQLLPALTSVAVTNYESTIQNHVHEWMDRLSKEIGKTINLGPWVVRMTNDMTLKVIIGESIGFIHPTPQTEEQLDAKHVVGFLIFGIPISPILARFCSWKPVLKILLRPRYKPDGSPKGLTGYFEFVTNCLQRRVDKGEPGSHTDVLSMLNQVRDDSTRKIDPEQMKRECANLLFAGGGSLAVAIVRILFDLGTDQEWQSLLRSEISEFTSKNPQAHLVSTTLPLLPRLNATIRESLRLSPSFSSVFERVTVPGSSIKVPGYGKVLRPGTRIGCNIYVVCRLKEIWGEDANVWRPQRWLDADEGQLKKFEESWVVFGAGHRSCIGKELAILAIMRTVSEFLMRFEIKSDESTLQLTNALEMKYEVADVWLKELNH